MELVVGSKIGKWLIVNIASDLAEKLGMKRSTMYARIRFGRPLDAPVGAWQRKS